MWPFTRKKRNDSPITLVSLNKAYNDNINALRTSLGFKEVKVGVNNKVRKFMFVLDFVGDIFATSSGELAEKISSIIMTADPKHDEVFIKVNSPGGAVHSYGYVASQLERLKKAGLKVTVSVDKVAASGGYMVACVADKIIAAPYSIVGSIGVVSEFPNYAELLKSVGVNYKQYTAGKFKRTVSPMTEPTEEAEKKMVENLENIHSLFKNHIQKHRPDLAIDDVATGETWQGIDALDIGLVDELMTSDEFLCSTCKTYEVYRVDYRPKGERWSKKVGHAFGSFIWSCFTRLTTLMASR